MGPTTRSDRRLRDGAPRRTRRRRGVVQPRAGLGGPRPGAPALLPVSLVTIALVAVALVAVALVGCTGPRGTRSGPRTDRPERLGAPTAAPPPPPPATPAPAAPADGPAAFEIRPGGALATPTPVGWRVLAVIPDGQVLSLARRPARGAVAVPVTELVDRWAAVAGGAAFAGPPGPVPAALSGRAVDGTPVSLAVEVADPAWNGADDTLLLTVRTTGVDRSAVLPDAFSDLTLFLDGARAAVEVDVADPTAVPLAPRPTDPAVPWSTVDGVDPVTAVGGDGGAIGLHGPTGTDPAPPVDDPTPGPPALAPPPPGRPDANLWPLTVTWDPDGAASAAVAQLSGAGLRLAGAPAVAMGVPVPLVRLPGTAPGAPARFRLRFDAA